MSKEITAGMVSRRTALRILGVGATLGAVTGLLVSSGAEAQTPGVERREDRRENCQDRRQDRRENRQDRRNDRQTNRQNRRDDRQDRRTTGQGGQNQ